MRKFFSVMHDLVPINICNIYHRQNTIRSSIISYRSGQRRLRAQSGYSTENSQPIQTVRSILTAEMI